MNARIRGMTIAAVLTSALLAGAASAADFPKPYVPPATERENVFAFTEKPKIKLVAKDKYEISFAVKGNCDVAAAIIDEEGRVIRHLGAGVLGSNAPEPFQKNTLKQKILWNGKDDLETYPRDASKLKVRVMLGLKPEFDKRLGGVSPHNIPGRIKGLAISPEGVFVLSMGRRSKFFIRKFGLDGKYIQSLVPPPADLPEKKLQGMGYIEYEKGVRALHGTDLYQSTADHLRYPIGTVGKRLGEIQPVVVGNRLYFSNTGEFGVKSAAYYIYTDGSTDMKGISGKPLIKDEKGREHNTPRFCASPDGKSLYLTGISSGKDLSPCVYRFSWAEEGVATPWAGDPKAPGSDDTKLGRPAGVACDAKGRVYVADLVNGRIQVFSPDAKLVKSIKMTKPMYVAVHPKTGAIYVQHDIRLKGKTERRTVKLRSLENPEVVAEVIGPYGMMALDSWSTKPRLWFTNTTPHDMGLLGDSDEIGNNISVWEERGKSFEKVMDFEEMAKKADGELYSGRWSGTALGMKLACDPTQETVMVGNRRLHDLKTGKFLGPVKIPAYSYDDVCYDKHGRLHVHLNPGFDKPGVIRVDPDQGKLTSEKGREKIWCYPEMPYDYGVEIPGKYSVPRVGALPVKDQRGAKYFQDGFGVNMGGDVAEQCNIYYVPKMDDHGRDFLQGLRGKLPPGAGGRFPSYERYIKEVKDKEKRGESVASIKREPGIDLAGGTIWTFKRTGEVMTEFAAVAGGLINGVHMDEDGKLYFVIGVRGRTRLINGKPWLNNQGGWYGSEKKMTPFTGTLVRSKGQNVRVRWSNAIVKMDPLPSRPADVGSGGNKGWVEGAAWLYAGASPIVAGSCSCPRQHLGLDWYKRAYVPEQYRHSIGILDTNGNLIMHLGRYGNFDSGMGPKSLIPVGGDGIGMSAVRNVSATDNYVVFDEGGERLMVLKLNCHAEETVAIHQ